MGTKLRWLLPSMLAGCVIVFKKVQNIQSKILFEKQTSTIERKQFTWSSITKAPSELAGAHVSCLVKVKELGNAEIRDLGDHVGTE